MIEFSDVLLCCFKLSRLVVFTEVPRIKVEDSSVSFFEAIPLSISAVGEIGNYRPTLRHASATRSWFRPSFGAGLVIERLRV